MIMHISYKCHWVAGMITHGHGHGMYGHFSINGLWPSDANATIGSLVLCLQNLERNEKHGLGDLGNDGMPHTSCTLLKALNTRKALDHHYKMRGMCDILTSATATTPFFTIEGGDKETTSSQILQPGSSHIASDALPKSTFCALPENLLLQLDNCAGENKNRYLFAYLSLLVAKGVFKTVQLGFLMVGHTHEDIDALFSRFSEKLRTGMTFTFPHLMDAF